MTSADSLSLILRCLDEIERKLDRMMEELRTTPTAIGYSVPPMPDAVSRLQLAHDEIKQMAHASVGTLAQLAFIG
jgi:hypothetical protein